jgi:uncharacterized membrane protein
MYRIIGGDQQEYGPYTAEQIRELIATRRASPATLAKTDQTPHWIPLNEFPEFAEDFARAATAPGGAPQPLGSAGSPLAMGEIFNRAWTLFTNNAGLLIGANFVSFFLIIALNAVPVVGPLLGLVLGFPLYAGPLLISLKLIRGQRAEFADTFGGFGDHFLALAAVGVVIYIGVVVGIVLLILPGILIWALWLFAPYNVIDRRMPFWDALEASRKTTQRHWPWYFGFVCLILVTFIAGACCCGIGIFVALPVITNATAIAYEDSERRAMAA